MGIPATSEIAASVLAFWREGHGATVIADRLGLTRGVVLGHLDRARKRGEDISRTENQGAPTPLGPHPTVAPTVAPVRTPTPIAKPVSSHRSVERVARPSTPIARPVAPAQTLKAPPPPAIPRQLQPPPMTTPDRPQPVFGAGPAVLALCHDDCHWPIGHVGDETFRFCCEPVRPGPAGQPPYCTVHLRLSMPKERAFRLFGADL